MKLTRNSFKKKIVVFGVSIFASLALTATGFATWVLSTGVEQGSEGSVTVGVTEESKIVLSELTFVDNIKDIKFEPVKDDNNGRVRWDGTNSECISVTFSCKLENIEVVQNINISLVLPEGVSKAIDEGYIVNCPWADGINITSTEVMSGKSSEGYTYAVADEGGKKVGTLTCTLSFKWGAKFGGMNPSEYFDVHEDGALVEGENVKVAIDTFRAMVYGKTYDEYILLSPEEQSALATPKYTVTVSATA